jgi:alkane 1-monooxygenase
VKGHHKKVATPEDPATSKLNENVYTFMFTSYIGGIRSSWEYETSVKLKSFLT